MTMESVLPRVKPTYGYYRQPNGWITVSPMADLDELHYTRRGWTALTQYGRIEMTTEYSADHPLEALFMQGGAKELCREQIIDSALHLTRPLIPGCKQPLNQYHPRHVKACMDSAVPVEFPQLNGDIPEGFQCRFCSTDPHPTEKARNQHESVVHKDEKGDIRTGETLAAALVKGLNGASQPAADEGPSGQVVLDVLANVGLNQTQLKALRAAGLIAADSNEANDSTE